MVEQDYRAVGAEAGGAAGMRCSFTRRWRAYLGARRPGTSGHAGLVWGEGKLRGSHAGLGSAAGSVSQITRAAIAR